MQMDVTTFITPFFSFFIFLENKESQLIRFACFSPWYHTPKASLNAKLEKANFYRVFPFRAISYRFPGVTAQDQLPRKSFQPFGWRSCLPARPAYSVHTSVLSVSKATTKPPLFVKHSHSSERWTLITSCSFLRFIYINKVSN